MTGVTEPRCCRRLCDAVAVEAVDVMPSRDLRNPRAPVRHYELCRAHHEEYFPHGMGYVDKGAAARLRIQCVAS